jgi:hypothetical protein
MAPYEHTREFIGAKAAIQERFLQVLPGRHVVRTEAEKLEALSCKLRDLAVLHRDSLTFSGISESNQRMYLREAIMRECSVLLGPAGQLYPKLVKCRDLLLREMIAEEPRAASPSEPPSPETMQAAPPGTKPAETCARYAKGDIRLLHNQTAANFVVAETYLGIKRRGLQKAIKAGKLEVVGEGRNKKVTVESLKRYLPPS